MGRAHGVGCDGIDTMAAGAPGNYDVWFVDFLSSVVWGHHIGCIISYIICGRIGGDNREDELRG